MELYLGDDLVGGESPKEADLVAALLKVRLAGSGLLTLQDGDSCLWAILSKTGWTLELQARKDGVVYTWFVEETVASATLKEALAGFTPSLVALFKGDGLDPDCPLCRMMEE